MAGKQQMVPMPGGGGKFLPKLISTVVVLAVLMLVVKHPTSAASTVNSLWDTGTTVVDGVSTFLQAVSHH